MLAPLAPGQQKDKLVFWSRTLYCCEMREGCRLRENGNPQGQGHSRRAGVSRLHILT